MEVGYLDRARRAQRLVAALDQVTAVVSDWRADMCTAEQAMTEVERAVAVAHPETSP